MFFMLLAFVVCLASFSSISFAFDPPVAQRREMLVARPVGDPARPSTNFLQLRVKTVPRDAALQLIAAQGPQESRPLTIGFYVTWDDSSFASLEAALPKLDWVVPSWLELAGANMELKAAVDQKSVELLRKQKPPLSVLPMLQNASDGKWDGPGLARLLADPAKRQALLKELVNFLRDNSAQGLVIDFEEVPKNAHQNLLTFLLELHAALAPHGWLLAIAAPFDDPEWTYRSYAAATDYQILMAYDEHFEEGEPGPIASQTWFVDNLTRRMKELDPAKTIIALGNYGYDWADKRPAVDLTFEETVLASKESEAPIIFDPQTLNPHFNYEEDDGSTHHVWFLNAVTAHNQMRAADAFRPRGYALWRLGSEDPAIWSLLGRP
jgi:spore germination protein YaaH